VITDRQLYFKNANRNAVSRRTDYFQRRREEQKLDTYAAAMVFDPVRTPEEELIERQECAIALRTLEELQPRIERTIRLRYGIGVEPHTLDQAGENLGVTKERVRQIAYKGETILKRKLWKKLRPEAYKAWKAERTRQHRVQMAREAENAKLREENERKTQEERWLQHQRDKVQREAQAAAMARISAKAAADSAWNMLRAEAEGLNALWDRIKDKERREAEERTPEARRRKTQQIEAIERRIAESYNALCAKARAMERALEWERDHPEEALARLRRKAGNW